METKDSEKQSLKKESVTGEKDKDTANYGATTTAGTTKVVGEKDTTPRGSKDLSVDLGGEEEKKADEESVQLESETPSEKKDSKGSNKEEPAPDYKPAKSDSVPSYPEKDKDKEVKEAKEEEKRKTLPPKFTKKDLKKGKKKEAAGKCLNWCVGSMVITILLVVFIIIPIACLVIGGMKINDCPVEKLIPIWLIVFGATFLVFLFLCILIQICARRRTRLRVKKEANKGSTEIEVVRDEPTVSWGGAILFILFAVFLFSWFICGNVWVFENWSAVEDDPSKCDEVAYYFAFSVIVLLYIIVIVLCCICCILVLTAVTSEDETGPGGSTVDDD